jgi:hypothetical protein
MACPQRGEVRPMGGEFPPEAKRGQLDGSGRDWLTRCTLPDRCTNTHIVCEKPFAGLQLRFL